MRHLPDGMSCREMVEHLSDYLDCDLDARLRQVIDAHNGECPPCAAFVRTLSLAIEAVRALPKEPLPPALKQSLIDALRRAAG